MLLDIPHDFTVRANSDDVQAIGLHVLADIGGACLTVKR
jgi:hypothetical protein